MTSQNEEGNKGSQTRLKGSPSLSGKYVRKAALISFLAKYSQQLLEIRNMPERWVFVRGLFALISGAHIKSLFQIMLHHPGRASSFSRLSHSILLTPRILTLISFNDSVSPCGALNSDNHLLTLERLSALMPFPWLCDSSEAAFSWA